MIFNNNGLLAMQRRAFDFLTTQYNVVEKMGPTGSIERTTIENPYFTNPTNVTGPAKLQQETPWVNTSNQFNFDFSINAPLPSATLNNRVLPKNNRAAIYGIQILFGNGANANNRVYQSHEVITNDAALYNSTISITMEQSNLVNYMDGQEFRDVVNNGDDMSNTYGFVPITPLRILTGEMGVFNLTISMINPISALVLSANLFISVRLFVIMGQAAATR